MRDDELRTLLREGDPGRDADDIDATEIARVRRRVVAAVSEIPQRRRTGFRFVLAFAVLLVVAVVSVRLARRSSSESVRDVTVATTTAEPTTPARKSDEPHVRRVEMSTPGGTRIVWTLDPDFEL